LYLKIETLNGINIYKAMIRVMNKTATATACPYFHSVVETNKTEVGQAGCGVTPNPISEGQSVVTSKQPFSFPPS
jgi:hypothetical protein